MCQKTLGEWLRRVIWERGTGEKPWIIDNNMKNKVIFKRNVKVCQSVHFRHDLKCTL